MSTPDPAWRIKKTPCPFYQSGRCIFKHKCNFIHDGEINMRRSDMRAHVPVYRRTPENSVDSFSSSEEDEPVQEHRIDEHSAAAPSLVFSSIYGPRPNSINRLQIANVDLPVSPESLPHTPPRTSRPTSHHSVHSHVNITSPTPSRPLSSSLGIGIGGRAQGGLAEVFTAIANTQTLAQSTALPPSSAGSLPSPLSLSPKSPANGAQEIIITDEGYSLEQLPFKLALSNQSSLLLNRTSRAAQRRSSSLSQRQDSSSSSGIDREQRPINLSVPEGLRGSLPKHPGGRPISVSSVERVEEEEQADDEQDEEEQEIVDESPSFEALQPYPRDVSTEPSPDPARQSFAPPAPIPTPPPPPAQSSKAPVRNNSSRYVDHELVIDELEERLGVSPARRRRARSNAVPNPSPSAVSPNRSTSQPTGKKADATWERKPPIEIPRSSVNMGAARNMLGDMFAKRDQQREEKIEEQSSDEQSFLPVDWDVGSMAGLDEDDQSGAYEAPVPPVPPVPFEQDVVRHESTAARHESTAMRRESIAPRHESVPARRESVAMRRESVAMQRKSIVSQHRTSIPVPIFQPSSPGLRPDVHPQTPSTPSTEPETPNTQLTQSTQPTPQSDHEFDETDTDDEHPEDLADLIEAEPVVLTTPRSVVLRREVGRETSLPSRAGTSTGTGTPGFWTPRHGSVVGGSGGLQVIESPIVEQNQPEESQFERRLSAERSLPVPSEHRLSVEQVRPTLIERRRSSRLASIERRQSAQLASFERRESTQLASFERRESMSSQQTDGMTQSTISEVTLNTVGGQAENASPVSRPLISDRDSVSALVLGSVPPAGNGLGLDLSPVPSIPSPSGSDSGNGLGLGLSLGSGSGSGSSLGVALDSDSPPSPLSFTSTPPLDSTSTPPLDSVPSGEELGSGSDSSLHSGSVFPSITPTPELPVGLVSGPRASVPVPPIVRPASPVVDHVLPHSVPQVPVLDPSTRPRSLVISPEPVVSKPVTSTEPIIPAPVLPDSSSRAEPNSLTPGLPTEPIVSKDSGSVPSVELPISLPPLSSEPNLTAVRVNPSLVAGPDFEGDLSSPHSLDHDRPTIPIYPSKPSGDLIEPIRATPHADGINSDSERVASRSSRDAVELNVPKLEDTLGDAVQNATEDLDRTAVEEEVKHVAKEIDVVVGAGEDKVKYSGTELVNEKGAASIEGLHADSGMTEHHAEGVHQELAEKTPPIINVNAGKDTVEGSQEDRSTRQAVVRDEHQETFKDVDGNFDGNIASEPVASGGDLEVRALVSESELEPTQDAVLDSAWPSASNLESVLPDTKSIPVMERPATKRNPETEFEAQAQVPKLDEVRNSGEVAELEAPISPKVPTQLKTPMPEEVLAETRTTSQPLVANHSGNSVESNKATVTVSHNEPVAETVEASHETASSVMYALPDKPIPEETHKQPEARQAVAQEAQEDMHRETQQQAQQAQQAQQLVRQSIQQHVQREVQQPVQQELRQKTTLVNVGQNETNTGNQDTREDGEHSTGPTIENLSTVSVNCEPTTEDVGEVGDDVVAQDTVEFGAEESSSVQEIRQPVSNTLLEDVTPTTNALIDQIVPEIPIASSSSALATVTEIPRSKYSSHSSVTLPVVESLASPPVLIEGEATLEPDHTDSLSELEESFGVRSPVARGSSPIAASSQPAVPSLSPITPPVVPTLVDSKPLVSGHSVTTEHDGILQHSAMIPPLTPLAPLSPILPSSPSVSPSPSEPLSRASSSPPTTSSLPGSPSQAMPIAPLTSSPLLDPLSMTLPLPPLENARSEDGSLGSNKTLVPLDLPLQPAPLRSKEPVIPEPPLEHEIPTQAMPMSALEPYASPSSSPASTESSPHSSLLHRVEPELKLELETEPNPELKIETKPETDSNLEPERRLPHEVPLEPHLIDMPPSPSGTKPTRALNPTIPEPVAPNPVANVNDSAASAPPPTLGSSLPLDSRPPLPLDHALLPATTSLPQPVRKSETIVLSTSSPPADRPQSPESVLSGSPVPNESTALSRPSPELEPSFSQTTIATATLSPKPLVPSELTETLEAFPLSEDSLSLDHMPPPSSATPVPVLPSTLNHSSSQPPVVDENGPSLAAPPAVEQLLSRDSAPVFVSPQIPESTLARLAASPTEASNPNRSLPEDPHPLSETTPLPVPHESSEPHVSESAPLPEPFEPTFLPELSKTLSYTPPHNSSLLLNHSPSNVSIPLESLSSPRSSSHSDSSPGQVKLPDSSLLPGSSILHESSSLILPSPFEPSPWPGLSVTPKRSHSSSLPGSPSSRQSPLPHTQSPLPDRSHSLKPSHSPNPTPLPDILSVCSPDTEPALPPAEALRESEHSKDPRSSQTECLDDAQGRQELQVTSDHQGVWGALDSLSPWSSLRLNRFPGLQRALDDEQQLPKSSLLFDYVSLPADSPPRSYAPSPRLATVAEDSPLLHYAPSLEHVQSLERSGRPEGDESPERVEVLEHSTRATLLTSLEYPDEPQSPSPIREAHFSQRSSLSEIPSLSDFAPLPPRSDTAPQYVRTATLTSEPRASSEPSSKPRPRSQLKPLRLSLMHGLGTSPPGAIITPVSANTATPSPSFRSDAATPTPTAMYPTPSSAHPIQLPARLRSVTHSPPPVEETAEFDATPEPMPGSSGPESVSWFGSKKGTKRGTLSASRHSFQRSIQEIERSRDIDNKTITGPGRAATSTAMERPEPSSPQHSNVQPEDEDVRPLPMIWDDETEAGSKAGSSRQGTRSPTHTIPVLEAFPPDSAPSEAAPALKSPDRLDTVPKYPTFVNVGGSPRISEGVPPLPSPPAASEPNSELRDVQPSEAEPVASRSRKWADTVNQDSLGSLPDFNAPVPSAQMLDVQPSESSEPHTPRKRKDHQHYMQIPNTAPLSISPRRVSPSIMQRAQEEGSGSYEQQDESSQDGVLSYATPYTAPLDLRLRMPNSREGTGGPWMTEHFTNSPSSLHSSQVGSMHSASSSLSIGPKAKSIRQSISSSKLVNGPIHVEDGTFGNPGPGPSTMKTYSKRARPAETLGSPIILQSSSRERIPSVPKTVHQHTPAEVVERSSRQPSSASVDATPRKPENTLSLTISPTRSVMQAEMSIHPATPSASTQSPIQTRGNEISPTEHRTPYKALSLSSPNSGPHPLAPLTAASPLEILRRNLIARTSPESPRFLSPQTKFTNLPEPRSRHQHHASASLAPMTRTRDEFRNMPMSAPGPRDRRSLTPNARFAATPSIPGSPAQSVHSTISQTKPLLFFAIAKNSAQEVERLLQDGEVKPNDKAGPEDLPALAFALANEQLTDKTQIVKSLLSHGADPSSVLHRKTGSGQFDDADLALTTRIEQGMNPAIRYYLNRKQMTIPTLQAELLEKNNFGGLTRAGFSIIGQDAALEELIRVVAGHCRRKALNPLVVVFSGGPGCGKSLLASKIGPLLHVPYFTVNMTNLRNEAALFNYISMTTKVGQPQVPLVDFLRNNQGQRCVVVLEEIEKAADKTVWHSLLMPWELGKATVISPVNNEQIDIDTSQVIWIATSNSGDDATLKFFAERSRPSDRGESALARLAHNPRPKEDNFTRNDYLQLMQAVRKRLGEILGSSMISRVSSVLPFLPFTEDEVYALASESLSAMRAEQKGDQSYESVDWDELLQQAVGEYIPGEGARSVHRAVQRAFDEITEW